MPPIPWLPQTTDRHVESDGTIIFQQFIWVDQPITGCSSFPTQCLSFTAYKYHYRPNTYLCIYIQRESETVGSAYNHRETKQIKHPLLQKGQRPGPNLLNLHESKASKLCYVQLKQKMERKDKFFHSTSNRLKQAFMFHIINYTVIDLSQS